jgi:hypothetical protein
VLFRVTVIYQIFAEARSFLAPDQRSAPGSPSERGRSSSS